MATSTLPLSPSPRRYSGLAAFLHWIIAVGITINVVLALSADSLSDTGARTVIDLHKSIGITVLGLAAMRLLWRWMRPPPDFPPELRRSERLLAHGVHGLLYALMFLMPLSGWMHDSAWKDAATHPMYLFGTFEWPRIAAIQNLPPPLRERMHDLFGNVHTALSYVLYVLVGAHVLWALKHQFVDRIPELQRMWPWGRD